jgi:hypothetical protein
MGVDTTGGSGNTSSLPTKPTPPPPLVAVALTWPRDECNGGCNASSSSSSYLSTSPSGKLEATVALTDQSPKPTSWSESSRAKVAANKRSSSSIASQRPPREVVRPCPRPRPPAPSFRKEDRAGPLLNVLVNTAAAAAAAVEDAPEGGADEEAEAADNDEADDEAGRDEGGGAMASDEPRMTGIRVGDMSGSGNADDEEDDDDDDEAAALALALFARPAPATDTGSRRRRTGVAAATTPTISIPFVPALDCCECDGRCRRFNGDATDATTDANDDNDDRAAWIAAYEPPPTLGFVAAAASVLLACVALSGPALSQPDTVLSHPLLPLLPPLPRCDAAKDACRGDATNSDAGADATAPSVCDGSGDARRDEGPECGAITSAGGNDDDADDAAAAAAADANDGAAVNVDDE